MEVVGIKFISKNDPVFRAWCAECQDIIRGDLLGNVLLGNKYWHVTDDGDEHEVFQLGYYPND